jgi:hypothetical protein
LNNLTQGLQLAEVLLGHPIPLVRLGDMLVTHDHEEWCSGGIPKKEPHFLPPVHGFRHGEVEIGIDAMPRLDMDVRTTHHHFHI